MPKPCRDSQRSKVYTWERVIEARVIVPARAYDQVTLEELRRMSKAIWDAEGGEGEYPTLVMAPKNMTHSDVCYRTKVIRFEFGDLCQRVLMHELAHLLTRESQYLAGGCHGPRFVGKLISMFVAYQGADRDKLLASAAEMGVKVQL